ncbi:MAG: N-acetylmuramoyl-L-alanine amidase, partial [Actinobacteria bacterium]|nr:N-acetylmuramoyl-L-alanine amidase [Actinomycetota bacterium]
MSRAVRVLLVVALAVAALLPGVGAAQAGTVPTTLSSVRAAQVGPVSPGFPIDAVGVTWEDRPGHDGHGDHAEEFGAVRFRTDGTWGDWTPFGEDGAQAHGSFGTSLVAGDDADAYQVRGVPAWAEVVALNTTDGPAREVRQRPAGAADAMTNCWSRYDWGADESLLPTTERAFAPVQVLTVHHTGESAHASGDPAAWVRSIYEYHLSRGWDDIGYQYLVGPGGELFEGRRSDVDSEACQSDPDGDGVLGDGADFAHDATDQLVTAAHTGGYNTGNAGVSVLGDYRTAVPTAASRQALVDVLAHLAGRHGLVVANDDTGKVHYDNGTNAKTVYSISMHKDFVATECPGGSLEADMPALRDDVAL